MALLEKDTKEIFRESTLPVLETERLVLRAPRQDDIKTIATLCTDLRIAANTTSLPHPYTHADAQSWFGRVNKSESETTFVVASHDGAILGVCGLGLRDRPPDSGVWLGYWFSVDQWGKGYATEAARAVIDNAFGDLGHEVLYAGARVSNPASRRVLEKCGFQWIGVGLYRVRSIASSAPVDRFRLDRGIWASLKSWGASNQSG